MVSEPQSPQNLVNALAWGLEHPKKPYLKTMLWELQSLNNIINTMVDSQSPQNLINRMAWGLGSKNFLNTMVFEPQTPNKYLINTIVWGLDDLKPHIKRIVWELQSWKNLEVQ